MIVFSINVNYLDWGDLFDEEYEESKKDFVEIMLDVLEKYLFNCCEKIEYVEVVMF